MRPFLGPATVLSNQATGAYRHLRLLLPEPVEARPGQFTAIAAGDEPTAMQLRRSFSLYRATPESADGPTLELVVADAGPGSGWITRRRPGDTLNVIAPLGKAFVLPKPGEPAVLVGGGYGAAPLVWLADALRMQGSPVHAVLGAASVDRLFGVPQLMGGVARLALTTDDGSAGTQGWVSDVLGDVIANSGADVVYGCGPMGMLRVVAQIARARGVAAWCAVEESMACGIGVCMTCVLPVRGADGKTRMLRACTDGPTFDGRALRWDAIRAGGGADVPVDCVGAPGGGGH
jgi:dihydroorotate dehydrogenase electron transfer subunit